MLHKSTDWKLLLIFKISIYSMYTSAWLTCISVHHQNSGAHRSQNRVLDPFGLEFQKAVNCHGNQRAKNILTLPDFGREGSLRMMVQRR